MLGRGYGQGRLGEGSESHHYQLLSLCSRCGPHPSRHWSLELDIGLPASQAHPVLESGREREDDRGWRRGVEWRGKTELEGGREKTREGRER